MAIGSFFEVDRFSARLGSAAATIGTKAEMAVRKTAHDLEATAKDHAPVDTGALKNSIYTEISNGGLVADIGPTVAYAPYLEHGTVKMAAQPFMFPAFHERSPELAKALRQLGARI